MSARPDLCGGYRATGIPTAIDRIIKCLLSLAERLQYPAGFLATAAAQFSDGERSVKALYDLTSMSLQQTFIGAGESVLGQMADHFKERRAHVIVEILGGEFLLSRPREPGADVGGKSGREFVSDIVDRVNQHF